MKRTLFMIALVLACIGKIAAQIGVNLILNPGLNRSITACVVWFLVAGSCWGLAIALTVQVTYGEEGANG